MPRFVFFVLVYLVFANPGFGANSRADLMFELNTALKTRDRIAFAECFNFEKTDVATQKSTAAIINQIFNWPAYHVFTSERDREGKIILSKDGKNWTLNGEWNFQIHVLAGKPPSKGFVFPAGVSGNRWAILLTIEDKS